MFATWLFVKLLLICLYSRAVLYKTKERKASKSVLFQVLFKTEILAGLVSLYSTWYIQNEVVELRTKMTDRQGNEVILEGTLNHVMESRTALVRLSTIHFFYSCKTLHFTEWSVMFQSVVVKPCSHNVVNTSKCFASAHQRWCRRQYNTNFSRLSVCPACFLVITISHVSLEVWTSNLACWYVQCITIWREFGDKYM